MVSLRVIAPYVLIFAVGLGIFANSMYGAFCFDDAFALLYNGDVHHQENSLKDIFFHDFWGHDIQAPDSHKSYRPITTISFRANYVLFLALGGNETRPSHIPEDTNGSTWQPEAFLFGLHLVNALLHAATSCLVYKLAKDLYILLAPQAKTSLPQDSSNEASNGDLLAILAGLLFATHPAHVEAVASIVGRAETLSAVFCLLGFELWRREPSWKMTIGAIVSVYISVLCKEITFAMYGAFLVWDMLIALNSAIVAQSAPAKPQTDADKARINEKAGSGASVRTSSSTPQSKQGNKSANSSSSSKTSIRQQLVASIPKWMPKWTEVFLDRTIFSAHFWLRYCCTLATILLYLRMRRVLMGDSIVVQTYRRVENPLAYIEDTVLLILSNAYLHANYLWILLYPSELSCDWSFNCIHLISSVSDVYNLFTMAMYALVTVPAFWALFSLFRGNRHSAPVLFLIFWGILFFMPAANIFFFVGTMLAERVLYLPSVGFAILTPLAIERLLAFLPKNRRIQLVSIICIVLVAAYSHRTWARNQDWEDNAHLFEAAEKTCPESAKVHFNLGILRTQQRNFTQAKWHFAKTLKIEPNYCEVAYRRALMWAGQQQYQLAISDFHAGLDCIYTRVESATSLFKIYQAFTEADPANAPKYAEAWQKVIKILEPYVQEEKEGRRPLRQG